MNTVTLIGRLTTDPTSRTVQIESGERTVTTLALAVPPSGVGTAIPATSTSRFGAAPPRRAPAISPRVAKSASSDAWI